MRELVHLNMIVPTHYRALAQSLCAAIAGPAGGGMFLRRVYVQPPAAEPPEPAEGDEGEDEYPEPRPATFFGYISTGRVDASFAALLPLNGVGGDPATIAALAVQSGIGTTTDEVAVMLAESHISDEDPHEHLARLRMFVATESTED